MTVELVAMVISSLPHLQMVPPVHKVGYLTKEGSRVKSWKKRLFVLNSLGLYYYKADDVRVGGEGRVQLLGGDYLV